MKELVLIQSKLKAPKNNFNKFGNYSYRSCEDILEALKPLLAEQNCSLVISDEIIEVGGRIYVKATSTITNSQTESISATAYAREDNEQKGMSAAQLTGSCSSYARKYALNGLFCCDDTKDDDATNTHSQDNKIASNNVSNPSHASIPQTTPNKPIQTKPSFKLGGASENQRKAVFAIASKKGMNVAELSIDSMTSDQASDFIKKHGGN